MFRLFGISPKPSHIIMQRSKKGRPKVKYRIRVLASIHARSALIFSSTSNDQICVVRREHFRNNKWQAASTS